MKQMFKVTTLVSGPLFLLAACGGGGGGGGGGGAAAPAPIGSTTYEPGVFRDSAVFEAQCASPRTGTDPETGRAFVDQSGSSEDENNWLRSWSNELYLWYSEIEDQNPADFSTPDYFELMKTTAVTASGNDRDRFHFSQPTEEWLQSSQSGVSAGYGAQFTVLSGSPPREVAIAYTEPNTPATNNGLSRGARLITIDGVDVANGNDVDTLNDGLFPSELGESHEFVVQDLNSNTTRTVTLTSQEIVSTPVQSVQTINTASGTVGYMLFNDHIRPAEAQLRNAVSTFQAANIDDLIIDLRYNGGGFLYIASQLSYMIAGQAATNGQAFETLTFNDKHPNINPVTGDSLDPLPFYGLSTDDDPLPTLNLDRVFLLTGASTCSASESIINSLRGVGVEVLQFGGTSCGKPYGFYPTDNCGTTYFSIQFRGENAVGFGDYPDGFGPQNASVIPSVSLPGCEVADDFNAALGDTGEARLAAALSYRENGTCPTNSGISSAARFAESAAERRELLRAQIDGDTPKPTWLRNRVIGR